MQVMFCETCSRTEDDDTALDLERCSECGDILCPLEDGEDEDDEDDEEVPQQMADVLQGETYMVRHNPNCPQPFEVRLSGLSLLMSWMSIGGPHLPIPKQDDDVGYGHTLEEAAGNAMKAREVRISARNRSLSKIDYDEELQESGE